MTQRNGKSKTDAPDLCMKGKIQELSNDLNLQRSEAEDVETVRELKMILSVLKFHFPFNAPYRRIHLEIFTVR